MGIRLEKFLAERGICSRRLAKQYVVDGRVKINGIQVFIPKKAFVFLAGTVLDYSDGLNGKGFEFQNPNAKSTCGCGTSFAA